MLYQTCADILRPTLGKRSLFYDISLVVGGSLLIAISAYIVIPLSFSPVPITAQTLMVLLIGALFGSRRGAAAVLAYLGQGIVGLPVFAGGIGGVAHLIGPTGGYLMGFVAAAYLTGWLAERGWDRRILSTLLAMSIGTAVIFVCGLSWLSLYVGRDQVLVLGLYPFIPGAVIKLVLAALILPTGWRLIKRFRGSRDSS